MLVLHGNERLEILLAAGFGFGLYSFLNGFRVFREYRVVEDTPEIPIRSAPMGLVRIHGKAMGDAPLLSPLTHQPCFFYKVDIEKWENNSRRSGWKHYRTDTEGVHFELRDPSGSIVVDPLGAKYDLLQSAKREVSSGISFGLGSLGHKAAKNASRNAATDQEILSYVNRAHANPISALVPTAGGPLREALAGAGPQSDTRKEQLRQVMLGATQHPAGSSEFLTGMRRAEEIHAEIVGGHKSTVLLQDAGHYGGSSWLTPPASGRYRLTECCILPGHYYDVTGTCTENRQADGPSRNLITKGQNEPEFLISWRSPQGVEKKLRNRAALMIFGGGGLAIVCLGFLLAKLGFI